MSEPDIERLDVALGEGRWRTRCGPCSEGREDACEDEDCGHSCLQRIMWNRGSCQHREILFGSVDQVTFVGRCGYCGFLVPA